MRWLNAIVRRIILTSKILKRQLLFKIRRILGQPITFDDIWGMCDEGAVEEAYVILGDMIENHPELIDHGATCIFWANLVLNATGDADRVMGLLDKANKLGDQDIAYYYAVRAEAMRILGNSEEAMENYERSIEIGATIYSLKGYGELLSENDDSHAMEIWQQVLEMDQENCAAHAYIGIQSAKSGDRDKALLMAKKAEKMEPSSKEYFLLTILYTQLDEFDLALDTCLKAKKMGYWDKALLCATIAACHFSSGRIKEGKKYALQALRHDPDHEYANEVWSEFEKRYERYGGN